MKNVSETTLTYFIDVASEMIPATKPRQSRSTQPDAVYIRCYTATALEINMYAAQEQTIGNMVVMWNVHIQ